MKQTAVEWLEEQFEESYSYINEIFKDTFKQAKAIEKEQIIEAYIESGANLEDIIKEAAEDYYNKQFKIN